MASLWVTVCWTAEGLHETRTNPASVKGQVAHPSPRCAVNQRRVASRCTCLGPGESDEHIDIEQRRHGHSLSTL